MGSIFVASDRISPSGTFWQWILCLVLQLSDFVSWASNFTRSTKSLVRLTRFSMNATRRVAVVVGVGFAYH